MGDIAAAGAVITVIAAVVVLVFGRDASLMRAVAAIRARRAHEQHASIEVPSEWRRADALVRKGEAVSTQDEPIREILDSDRLADSLARLYPRYPLLVLDGVRMPVWAAPVRADQRDAVDSILGHLAQDPAPDAMTYPDRFCPGGVPTFHRKHEQRRALPESERHRLASNPTYSLSRAIVDPASGSMTLDCRMGRYFTHLATTRALSDELLGALSDDKRVVPLESLPMRRWLHTQVSDPVTDGSRRDAALGLSTLVVVRRQSGGYYAIFPTRAEGIATDPLLMHVCPAGMLQPFTDNPEANVQDFSVVANFEREYVEELFSEESAERAGGHFDAFRAGDFAPIARLHEHLRTTPQSWLRLTGFCVNLLTLQPEVCLLLFIDDPDWLRREAQVPDSPLKFGWEIASVSDHPRSWLLEIDDNLRPLTDGPLRPSNLVPQAAAALKLGLDVIREEERAAD